MYRGYKKDIYMILDEGFEPSRQTRQMNKELDYFNRQVALKPQLNGAMRFKR